jgi:hypothetical protein
MCEVSIKMRVVAEKINVFCGLYAAGGGNGIQAAVAEFARPA